MKNTPLDMTRGRPVGVLLRFALPLILGSLLQQLYSFVDSAVIGRFIGETALGAVGVTGSLNFFVLGLTMGSAIGFAIPLSHSVGEGDRDGVNRGFWNGLYLTVAIGLAVSLGTAPFVSPLLRLMNTSEAFLPMATEYLTVIFLGQITVVLYNYLAGVIRAFGDSKSPFVFLVISGLLNLLLDLLFVAVIPMGVVGAALATVIAQLVSVLLCLRHICRHRLISLSSESGEPLYLPSGSRMARILLVGLPIGVEYSVCSIGNLLLQGSINTLGDLHATAQYCGERIRSIATIPMESVGTAVATYAAQNFGARRIDRVRSGVRSGLLIQAVYSLSAYILLLLLKRPLVAVLIGDGAAFDMSVEYISVISLLFILHGSLMVFRNTVQGMGYGASTLLSSLMEIIGRSGAGFLAVGLESFLVICLSAPAAWALALVCCILLYLYYIRRAEKLQCAEMSEK